MHTVEEPVYWLSPVGEFDDFGNPIENIIIDGRTKQGPWALMSEGSWMIHGGTGGRLGTGLGQKYHRQVDGRWLKVEG
jgi:hypothetical protein